MLKFSRSQAVSGLLTGIIAFGNMACTQQPEANKPTGHPAVSQSTPKAIAKQPVSKPKPDPSYKLALDKADSAQSISQSAQSPEDWNLVVSRWQQAVNLLKKLPATDPQKKLANQKLVEFQASLQKAQARANRSGKDRVATLEPLIVVDSPLSETLAEPASGTYQARIKYRDNRIPVIEVVFNGRQSYDMMVDTGASGTMITPDMAKALQIKIIGSASAMTPAGVTEVAIGVIKSIRVGSHTVRDVQVAVGPVRLLGHDFFGNCDIGIKQNVVEFGQC